MSKRPAGGFFLVEALMALALLTGGLVVVAQAFRTTTRLLQEAGDQWAASLRLEEDVAIRHKTGPYDGFPVNDERLGPLDWQHRELPAPDSHTALEETTLSWGIPPQRASLVLVLRGME